MLLWDGCVFLSNFGKTGTFEATLRVTDKAPELFNPVTGQITRLARFKTVANGTRVSLDIRDSAESCFVVFRSAPTGPSVVAASASPSDLNLFFDERNRLMAQSSKAGTYALNMSNGTKRRAVVAQGSRTFAIDGPWKETRKDVKGYSVLRETAFQLPVGFAKGQCVVLDLGSVAVMAEVTLNGKSFDTLWMPPFELDVTDAVTPGRNELHVLMTSTSKGRPSLGQAVLRTSTRKGVGE